MSVIMSRALPGRARRPQAGAPPDHLGHGAAGLPARPPVREVRPRHRRHDGQVPPARQQRDLRRPGAHGPALLAAPPAHRLPRQLRLARLRARGRALHGVPPARRSPCRWSPTSTRTPSTSQPTYDGSNEEPVVLPARFPNLLVNGSQGIAVGMATNIPPHNLGEVIDATVHLIDHPDATPDDLMQFVQGPDFPTGGFIMGRAGIMEAYRTGRGSVKMRAKADHRGDGRRGGGMEIVVTRAALPGQLQGHRRAHPGAGRRRRARRHRRRQRQLGRRQDQPRSSRLRRDANANVVLNNLFKQTQLQTSFAVNMVALVDGVPRTLNLVQALQGYIAHQVEVITRRSQYRLDKARRDEEIQEGLLRALNVIDEVIALIRASEDRAAARSGLMERFGFTELQSEHILEMRLGQLTRLSRIDIEQRLEKLREQIAELEAILNDDGRLRAVIKEDLLAIKEQFATPRVAAVMLDEGEMSDRGPGRRQGAGGRHDRGRLRQDGRGRLLQDPGPRWPWGGRGQAQERRPGQPRHLHDRPRLPAVLLQPGQGLPAAGDGHPRARSHGQGHPHRQPAAARRPTRRIRAIIDTRTFAGRALPLLRHPRRAR